MTNLWTTGQVVRDRDASRHFWLQPTNQLIEAPFCALEESSTTTIASRQVAPRELEEDPIDDEEPPLYWADLFTYKGETGKKTYRMLAFLLLVISPMFVYLGLPMFFLFLEVDIVEHQQFVFATEIVVAMVLAFIFLMNTIKRYKVFFK